MTTFIRSKPALALVLTFATCVMTSCSREATPPRPMPDLPGSVQIGTSVEGRPIHSLTLGSGADTTLILATIHGNENAGTPLVHRLAERLRSDQSMLDGRKVVIVPVINPDGYAKDIRTNARGVDLNRNFAAENRENSARYGMSELSEPESRTILQLLEQHRPARIVTIHQPLECVDWDGTASVSLAKHMGRYCYLPVKRVGSRPGSLGSYAGLDLKIPIITYELPRNATALPFDELWARYGLALLASVTYPDAPPQSIADTPATGRALVAGGVLVALIGGIALLGAGRGHSRELRSTD